jgi:proline racemase/trans-L-3-hydroxyproline dehydratase
VLFGFDPWKEIADEAHREEQRPFRERASVERPSTRAGRPGPDGGGTGVIETVDYHTAGEPFRIVTGGAPEIGGATVAARRENAMTGEADQLRALLCNEPRGHADMYGCFAVPPDDDGALLGVLFWHKDGFSTACGHGTIALGAYAVDAGLVAAPDDGAVDVVIDVPSGRVTATVQRSEGRTVSVAFRNVPAYVVARGVPVPTRRGEVYVDISYGGASYASVHAGDLGLTVAPADLTELIAVGRQIRDHLNEIGAAPHPTDDRLAGIYGTIWYEDIAPLHQRNCTIFADGEVDRSPCGSGTSARLALLHADGAIASGQPWRHDSIIGTTFEASVVEATEAYGRAAVVTEVRGSAFRTGEHRFVLDPHDPLGHGFQLR